VFGVNEAFFGGSSVYCWLKEATQIVLRAKAGGWFTGTGYMENIN
jgi:hypothetical protein